MAEHPAVNRRVAGSSPARGATPIISSLREAPPQRSVICLFAADYKGGAALDNVRNLSGRCVVSIPRRSRAACREHQDRRRPAAGPGNAPRPSAEIAENRNAGAQKRKELSKNSLFREEVYADWQTGQSCLEMFGGSVEPSKLVVSIHLAMENVTTISVMTDLARSAVSVDVGTRSDVVGIRKRYLRRSLQYWIEGNASKGPDGALLAISRANERYMQFVRDPITLHIGSRVQSQMPSSADLREFRERTASKAARSGGSEIHSCAPSIKGLLILLASRVPLSCARIR
jgi:hypothetical protein